MIDFYDLNIIKQTNNYISKKSARQADLTTT